LPAAAAFKSSAAALVVLFAALVLFFWIVTLVHYTFPRQMFGRSSVQELTRTPKVKWIPPRHLKNHGPLKAGRAALPPN
jgi:hypothetical protein